MRKRDPETMKIIWRAYKVARVEILFQAFEPDLNVVALVRRIASDLILPMRHGARDPVRLAALAAQISSYIYGVFDDAYPALACPS